MHTDRATFGRVDVAPARGDPDIFARQPFILGVSNGFVDFSLRLTSPARG